MNSNEFIIHIHEKSVCGFVQILIMLFNSQFCRIVKWSQMEFVSCDYKVTNELLMQGYENVLLNILKFPNSFMIMNMCCRMWSEGEARMIVQCLLKVIRLLDFYYHYIIHYKVFCQLTLRFSLNMFELFTEWLLLIWRNTE